MLFILRNLLIAALINACAPSALFPKNAEYTYSFNARVSTGSIQPKHLSSVFNLKLVLKVQKIRSNAIAVELTKPQHTIYNVETANNLEGLFVNADSKISEHLSEPFIITFNPSGVIDYLNITTDEPIWSTNIKRAIAVNLQLQNKERTLPGAFTAAEPCLHNICDVEYSSSDGVNIRKSNAVPTLHPTPTHQLWMSVMTNECTNDTKNPLIGNVDRWYNLDENGLNKMTADGTIQVHYHNHIFQSLTVIKMERTDIQEQFKPVNGEFTVQTTPSFKQPIRYDPTGGRAAQSPSAQLEQLWNILGKIADRLEHPKLSETLLKDKLTLRLHEIISTLSYDTLKKANEELELGTSYKWETMKNIFMEGLPQAKSAASILLIRDLINEKKISDDMTILQLLRKVPFNIADLDQELLKNMESLLKLSPHYSREVRHTAILTFSSLVYMSFIRKQCSPDVFEYYAQTFFLRYTGSPDYADRLVWLSALSNLQLEHVTAYLAPIISSMNNYSTHERFIAAWGTMPTAHLYKKEVHSTYWPILHNETEPLEMRVAAITMLLVAEPSAHRLLSLHWYITSQDNPHLTNYFYTTIKSFEKTTFDCYKELGKYASYLSKIVKPPPNPARYWSTGNYLFDFADSSRDMGFMFQMLVIGNEITGIPEIFYFTLITHNAGLIIQDYSVFIKLQGVINNIMENMLTLSDNSTVSELIKVFQSFKVKPIPSRPIHIEILTKYHGKIINTLHFNQTTLNDWNVFKTFNELIRSQIHINQQVLLYPAIVKSTLPSELGTPVITDTIISSLTSIRGNLTYSETEQELARRNDLHLRTSTLAMLSLTAYNPIADTYHLAEVAQVSDAYLPSNFTISVSSAKKNLKLTWLSPTKEQLPGFVANSGARVAMVVSKDIILNDFCPACHEEMMTTGDRLVTSSFSGMDLECNGPATVSELFWELITSHKSNANVLPITKPLLILLHGVILGMIPAKGPCKLVLSSENYFKTPQTINFEYTASLSSSTMFDHTSIIELTRTDDQIKETYSILNLSTHVKIDDRLIKIASKASTKKHKVCFSVVEVYSNDTFDNINVRNNLESSDVSLAIGPSRSDCPINETLFKLSFKPTYSGDNMDAYRIESQLKNVPQSVSTISSKYGNIFNIFGPKLNLFSLQAVKLIANELSRNDAMINATVQTDNGNVMIKMDGMNDSITDTWTKHDNWYLNPPGKRRILIDRGIRAECHIKRDHVVDFRGRLVNFEPSCEVLTFADCSKIQRFALIKIPSEHGLRLKYYIGNNFIEINPSKGGAVNVTVNEKQIGENEIYNETIDKFKVAGEGNKIKIETETLETEILYRIDEAVISFWSCYLSTSCGACLKSKDLYVKC